MQEQIEGTAKRISNTYRRTQPSGRLVHQELKASKTEPFSRIV